MLGLRWLIIGMPTNHLPTVSRICQRWSNYLCYLGMAAVDLGPRRLGRRAIVRAAVTALDSSLSTVHYFCALHDLLHMTERVEFMLSSTVVALTSHTCTYTIESDWSGAVPEQQGTALTGDAQTLMSSPVFKCVLKTTANMS